MTLSKNPKAVDLFCGCGGISVGLRSAGFEVIAGIDIEKKYIITFRHNFPNAKALNIDITKIAPEEFADIIDVGIGELDILVGGPPCQGFSKNVPRRYRYLDDPKNLLVKSFLDYCEVLQPKMVLMENVAEMKNGFEKAYSEEIISRLDDEGYTVTTAVLNAADYGVPQRRRRAFFMANRYDIPFLVPPSTHSAPTKSNNKAMRLFDLPSHINVWDAIGDLPSVNHGEGFNSMPYAIPPQSEFQIKMRENCKEIKNHVARKMAPKQYERLASLKAGQGHKDLPEHLQVQSGYSGAYGRLTKDMIAPTITRWVFHPGSGRWGHPVDIRTLTIREVARIQSFHDDFEFVGSYTDQAGQLGNAVPPLLAQYVVQSMKNQLSSKRYDTRLPQLTFEEGSLNAIA